MATIEERTNTDGGKSFRVKIRRKGYPTESRTFNRKTDAKKYIRRVESEMDVGKHRIPPKMSVSKVVGILKANTSRRLKEKFTFLKEVYWGTDGIWSDGYFVSTVGVNEQTIQEYIRRQGEEDSGQA